MDLAYLVTHWKIISLAVWWHVEKTQHSFTDLMVVPVAFPTVFPWKTPPSTAPALKGGPPVKPIIGISCVMQALVVQTGIGGT